MTSQLVREFMTSCGTPLPPRRGGVDRARIIACAGDLADVSGPMALTAQRLAESMRTKPVLLFKFFADIDAIIEGVAARVLDDLLDLYDDAASGRIARDALCALGHAERTYAQARPGRYRIALQTGARQSAAVIAQKEALLRRLGKTLESYGLDEESAQRAARSARAAIQGFIVLELTGALGTPFEIDQCYQGLLDMLDRGARSQERGSTPDIGRPWTPPPQRAVENIDAWRQSLARAGAPQTNA